jgi:hypothetical protein
MNQELLAEYSIFVDNLFFDTVIRKSAETIFCCCNASVNYLQFIIRDRTKPLKVHENVQSLNVR